MDLLDQSRPQRLSPYRFHIFAVLTALTAFSLIYGPGRHTTTAKPVRDPMTLIASPNEPLMIQAIRYAQARRAEDGPWGGAQRKQGPTATFQTPSGSITMTRTEIADANAFYPQLVGRAKDANR